MREVKNIYISLELENFKNFMRQTQNFKDRGNRYFFLNPYIPEIIRNDEKKPYKFNLYKELANENDDLFLKAIDLFFFLFKDHKIICDHIKKMVQFCHPEVFGSQQGSFTELCLHGDVIRQEIAKSFGITPIKIEPKDSDWIIAIQNEFNSKPEYYFFNALFIAKEVRNNIAHTTDIKNNNQRDTISFLLYSYIGTCLLLLRKKNLPSTIKLNKEKEKEFNWFRMTQVRVKTDKNTTIRIETLEEVVVEATCNSQASKSLDLPLHKTLEYEITVVGNSSSWKDTFTIPKGMRDILIKVNCKTKSIEVVQEISSEPINDYSKNPIKIEVTPKVEEKKWWEKITGKHITIIVSLFLAVFIAAKLWGNRKERLVTVPQEIVTFGPSQNSERQTPKTEEIEEAKATTSQPVTAKKSPTAEPKVDTHYEAGMTAYNQGNGLEAIQSFQTSGTAESLYMLGLIYEQGCGNVGANPMKARSYYTKAKKMGSQKAAAKL